MYNTKGIVYIVGAGPGDPSLITLKGLECISKSNVIIYDYLASPMLLKYALKDTEIIYVGKKAGDHTMPQEAICDLIVQKAKDGNTVCRLKGGDPFIFGRGGEEIEALKKAGLPFEVVPGITSAIAVPAYAGIPLTHRKANATLAFVTGNEDPNKEGSNISWESLANIGTLVFLMGVGNLKSISEKLISHGKSPDTKVALIRWGTTPNQVTITGNLSNIFNLAEGIKPPAIIVVGDVVGFREDMLWYEKKPLFGKRIVVTRSREQASELVKCLSDLGAECIECPTIKINPIKESKDLDNAIENLSNYDWIVFTSANGVEFFFKRLFEQGKDVRALSNIKTSAIGPATAKKLLEYGFKTDIIPDTYISEAIVRCFEKENIKNKKILVPRAKEAREILVTELSKMGALVNEVPVYSTEQTEEKRDVILSRLQDKTIDIVTFTSSSTAKNFRALLPDENWQNLMAGVSIAAIGPITAKTAQDIGFNVKIVAETYTIQGLITAILNFLKEGLSYG
ncbi:MAG: uroporphyrinogen-III C-methyltransferase [Desulfobacterales bacterium]|nr:uroporphyrinogen-III C-methyltransferase [Desulfobacterales bacterium]MBF0397187.1 uroporphyrinogen-III C-methyltransferase [Desulfobacterales bacterium]